MSREIIKTFRREDLIKLTIHEFINLLQASHSELSRGHKNLRLTLSQLNYSKLPCLDITGEKQ